MTRRGRRPHRLSRQQQALAAWLELQMADPVAARLAFNVTTMHAGLIAWMAAAEQSTALPDPFRLPGDERPGGVAVGSSVSKSRDPDDAMVALVDRRVFGDPDQGRDPEGADPERLEPIRQYLAHRLSELAGWYVDQTGSILPDRWEPLAVRLGDLLGDQIAANALATCLLGHHHLAITTLAPSRGRCQAARERWRRLADRYVRTLDQQPDRQPPKAVGGRDGEGRWYG